MKFRQERLIFDNGNCVDVDGKLVITTTLLPDPIAKKVYGEGGYSFLSEEEYLNNIAVEGWVLHTANYCVLGKQECHYFLFVKE